MFSREIYQAALNKCLLIDVANFDLENPDDVQLLGLSKEIFSRLDTDMQHEINCEFSYHNAENDNYVFWEIKYRSSQFDYILELFRERMIELLTEDQIAYEQDACDSPVMSAL